MLRTRALRGKERDRMMIVSANYLKRQSPNRWLVRSVRQDPKQAQEAQTVYAEDVSFVSASGLEARLGCSRVAHCRSAVINQSLPQIANAHPLKLGCAGFYFPAGTVDKDHAIPAPQVAALILKEDGSALAVPYGEEPQIVAPRRVLSVTIVQVSVRRLSATA